MFKNLTLPGGDHLYHDERAVIITLRGKCRVFSTSCLNGGCREDLGFLFNYCEIYGKPNEQCEMRASTYEEHLGLIAAELGLDPVCTAGLSTSAKMKYAVVQNTVYNDFSVTAVVTAGIDANGSRVGDPASWHETDGLPAPVKQGTINIILMINANLTPGALARALVVSTEAKTAALQELLAPSCYSEGLATGSGTDGAIIVSNLDSSTRLSDAGQHSKLGEYIGRTVKEAVKEALVAENGFDAYIRNSFFRRIKRFGIDIEGLWLRYCKAAPESKQSFDLFVEKVNILKSNRQLVSWITLYTHLLDLLQWQLIDPAEAVVFSEELLRNTGVARNNCAADRTGQANKLEIKKELTGILASSIVAAMLEDS